jgi:hypothetical protein
VGPEFRLDVAGEAAVVVLASVRKKRLKMPVYEAVENGLGGTAEQIRGGERSQRGHRRRRSRAAEDAQRFARFDDPFSEDRCVARGATGPSVSCR